MNTNSEIVIKTKIPNYIIDMSLNYNKFILPIFLYMKERSNSSNTIYFYYRSMTKYYEDDKWNAHNEDEVLTALIFLLNGATEKICENCMEEDIEEIIPTFEIDNYYNALINLLSTLKVTIIQDTQQMILSNNINQPTKELIKILKSMLKEEIKLYDLSIEVDKGYLLVDRDVLEYIAWYYRYQINQTKKITENYRIKDEETLNQLIEEYEINKIKSNVSQISYTSLISIYLYILKLYTFNRNINQTTNISSTKMASLFSMSNSTVITYMKLFEYLKLIKTSAGSFKGKVTTKYTILNSWRKTYEKLYNLKIFNLCIVTKEQYKELMDCYEKK